MKGNYGYYEIMERLKLLKWKFMTSKAIRQSQATPL
jgi:hypothetical protein